MPDDALLAAAGDLRRAYHEVDWAATPVGRGSSAATTCDCRSAKGASSAAR